MLARVQSELWREHTHLHRRRTDESTSICLIISSNTLNGDLILSVDLDACLWVGLEMSNY